MLLKEVRVLTDLQIISESRDTGIMCIRGTFQRAEEANHNQRIYPRAVLENCVKNLHEKLKGRELVGELDHPADGVVKLQNASHLITKLEWKGNDLIGEAEILPTPAGQIAKSLINAGVKIGISSRGMGTLSESVKGPKIVNDDYKMITFDLVADPSTKGAYPSLAESRQHAIDFVENVIKPAISEKAFVARLKKALHESKITEKQFSKFEVLLESSKCQKKPKANVANRIPDRQISESRRDAARAKLEEMCGPTKHKKKKKVNENYRKPLTITALHEQELINEAVPALLSALGRGAKGLAKGAKWAAGKTLGLIPASARAFEKTFKAGRRRVRGRLGLDNPNSIIGSITRTAFNEMPYSGRIRNLYGAAKGTWKLGRGTYRLGRDLYRSGFKKAFPGFQAFKEKAKKVGGAVSNTAQNLYSKATGLDQIQAPLSTRVQDKAYEDYMSRSARGAGQRARAAYKKRDSNIRWAQRQAREEEARLAGEEAKRNAAQESENARSQAADRALRRKTLRILRAQEAQEGGTS